MENFKLHQRWMLQKTSTGSVLMPRISQADQLNAMVQLNHTATFILEQALAKQSSSQIQQSLMSLSEDGKAVSVLRDVESCLQELKDQQILVPES